MLTKLAEDDGDLPQQLSPRGGVPGESGETINESWFRWEMNEDVMATEKLAEGMRNIHADSLKLERLIEERLI